MTDAPSEALSVNFSDVAPPGPEIPPPPKREALPDPHGDGQGEDAPKPKRGRPPKSARARTTTEAKSPAKAAAGPVKPRDYSDDLTAVTDGLWLAGSQIAPVAPYAAIVKANQAGLVASLNTAANQNSTVRTYVDKLSGGGNGSWMLSLGMVGISMAMQTAQVMKSPELRQQFVESNAKAVQGYLEKISGQADQANSAPEA